MACTRAAVGREAAATAAAELVERMRARGLAPTAACFTAVGRAAMRCGDWRRALDAYDACVASSARLEIQFSDVKVAISAAAHGEQWERAATLVEDAAALRGAALRGAGGVRAAPSAALSAAQRDWLWRTWSHAQLCRVRAALLARKELFVDEVATAQLQRALSTAAADGRMPSFADSGARAGYTVAHLPSRTRKVAEAMPPP